MSLTERRRLHPERVRHTLRNMPEEQLTDEYGEHIVMLRTSIYEAIQLIEGGYVSRGLRMLRDVLASGVGG